MTAEESQNNEPVVRPPIILAPGLVFLVAIVFYALTLNHGLTFGSVPFIAQVTGWNWHPAPLLWRAAPNFQPLCFILTYPFRWLPAGAQVIGLNLFMALCASLTLAILARSVRLLSHDRTPEQREKVFGQLFAYFGSVISHNKTLLFRDRTKELRLMESAKWTQVAVRGSFLAAGLAVVLLGAQLTFWENAVSGTGEMVDLLIFAFLIECLLEFRVSKKNHWLFAFSFVYGVGLANDWSLIGYAPFFLIWLAWFMLSPIYFEALPTGGYTPIWFTTLAAFKTKVGAVFGWIRTAWSVNWRCLLVMIVCLVMGLGLYILNPALGAMRDEGKFWDLMHQWLGQQHYLLHRTPHYYFAVSGLPSVIALVFAFTGWPSFNIEFRNVTDVYTRLLFRLLHIAFLVISVLMFFDIEISPSPRARFSAGLLGPPTYLSFYYMAALCVGYFFGHVFFFFAKDLSYHWGQPRGVLRNGNLTTAVALWIGAIAAPVALACINFAHIREFDKPIVSEFADELARTLPAKPGIVMADDSTRLYLAMDACRRLGLPSHYVFVESPELNYIQYVRYLAEHYPSFKKEIGDTENLRDEISDVAVGNFLAHLAGREPVYYLHPGFGNRFERVFMAPHRMGGIVLPDPTNALATLLLSRADIGTNQAFWHALEKDALRPLPEVAKKNANARLIATYYSQCLDYWGTELQKEAAGLRISDGDKSSLLKDAADQFQEALRLNPDNIMAKANLQFNLQMRGIPDSEPPLSVTEFSARIFQRWDYALNLMGPPDTPALNNRVGEFFGYRNLPIQAAHMFQRCLELSPKDPDGELNLAKTYIDLNQPDAALKLLGSARAGFTGSPLELIRVEALAYATKRDFAAAEKLLTDERAKDPGNARFLGVMAEFYRRMGYFMLREEIKSAPGKGEFQKEAARWFAKAVQATADQLKILNASGAEPDEISDATLSKAEVEMTMKDYQAAIATLGGLLERDPKNTSARLNRAISEFELHRFDASREDFLVLEKQLPAPSSLVYDGLAKVAKATHDKEAQIRYDKLYLDYARTDAVEFTNVTRELRALQGK